MVILLYSLLVVMYINNFAIEARNLCVVLS